MTSSATEGLLTRLAQAVPFQIADLNSNRIGELAADQVTALRSKVWQSLVVFGLIVLLPVCGFFILASNTRLESALPALIGVILLLLIGLIPVIQGIQLALDLFQRRVEMMEGPVTGDYTLNRGIRHYFYKAGKFRFSVSAKACEALSPNQSYRIYYTPNRKVLVAIEPI